MSGHQDRALRKQKGKKVFQRGARYLQTCSWPNVCVRVCKKGLKALRSHEPECSFPMPPLCGPLLCSKPMWWPTLSNLTRHEGFCHLLNGKGSRTKSLESDRVNRLPCLPSRGVISCKNWAFSEGREEKHRHIPLVFCRTVECFTKATSPFSTRHLHSEAQVRKEDPQEQEAETPRRNMGAHKHNKLCPGSTPASIWIFPSHSSKPLKVAAYTYC